MTDATEGEVWQRAAIKAVADIEADAESKDAFWWRLGVDRDDVIQEATIRAWKASERHDGSAPLVQHCYMAARYAVRNYIYDQTQQSGQMNADVDSFLVGLDDEVCDRTPVREVPFTDLSDEEVEELQGRIDPAQADPARERRSDRAYLRHLLDGASLSCLTDRERRVLYGRFGIGQEVPYTVAELAEELGLNERTVYRDLETAMEKMRGEMQAARVLGEIE